NDMIAGLELSDQRRRHRRHTGGRRTRRFGALEGGHAALAHRDRRIREARIEVTWLFALEACLALLGAVVDKTLGEEQRFGSFAELRAQLPAVNEFGLG